MDAFGRLRAAYLGQYCKSMSELFRARAIEAGVQVQTLADGSHEYSGSVAATKLYQASEAYRIVGLLEGDQGAAVVAVAEGPVV